MRIDPIAPSAGRVPAARTAAPSEPQDTFTATPDPEADLSRLARQSAKVLLEPTKETREREILFRFQADESVTAEPTPLEDGSFVVSSCDRHVYRVDGRGKKAWEFWTGAVVYCEPAVARDGTVYVGNNDGKLFALTPQGKEKWHRETHSAIRSRVALDGQGRVFVRGDDDRLRCLSPKGKEQWQVPVPQSVSLKTSPSMTPTGEVAVGDETGHVRLFDASGQQVWVREVGEGPVPPPAVADDGTLYVATAEGHMVALDPSGKVKWDRDLGGVPIEVGPFVGRDGRVYVHDVRDRLHALNPDGSEQWSKEFEERLSRHPAADAEGHLYLNVDNEVWRLDSRGEVEWRFRADDGDEIWTSPVLRDDGSLLVGGKDGVVYAVKPIDLQLAEDRRRLERGEVPVETAPEIAPEDGWIRIGGIRLPVRG